MRTRESLAYDVCQELRTSWPSWSVEFGNLGGVSELFDVEGRRIVLDLRHWPEGAEFAMCHALSHLEWGHDVTPGDFTHEQEDVADWAAGVKRGTRGACA